MKIVQLQQGSAQWHAHRAHHFNASDAPAMMGCSPYKTRAQLLREIHTGLAGEVDASTQRIFDAGHRFEALARPLAEEIVGDDLYPCVGVEGKYSASFDGLTLGGETALEHKTLNAGLQDVFDFADPAEAGHRLPKHYRVQMEHQCMVSGAERVLFMATKWADDDTLIDSRHCWYLPDDHLRAEIIGAWRQFAAELAAYTPPPLVEKAQAEPMESLPAVAVRLDGALTVAGNLPSFAQALRAFIGRMPKQPTTDNDFATTDAACKALKKAEEALDAAEAGALASITDVEAMRRAVADCRKLARDTRLAAEKLVERRKTEIKEQAVAAARRALDDHIAGLNAELAPMSIRIDRVDFAAAIKGLRSIASMQDALDTALAGGKIAADGYARTVRANVAAFKAATGDVPALLALFADLGQLVHKAADDFAAVLDQRITKHRADQAERERKAAEERAAEIAAAEERARQQERDRLAAEQRQQAEAQAQAQAATALAAAAAPAVAPAPLAPLPVSEPARPTPQEAAARILAAHLPDKPAANEPATVNMGALADSLGFTLRADFIATVLGIQPTGRAGAAVLYRPSQVPLIVAALQRHLARVLAGLSVAA